MYEYLVKKDDDKLIIVGEGTKITVNNKKDGLTSVKTEQITENEYLLFKIELLEKRVAELEGSQEQSRDIELCLRIDSETIAKQVIESINDYQKRHGRIIIDI